MIIELLGYLGMFLVVLSFLFKKTTTIRVINISGAILSAIYGLLTNTYPTMFLNLTLILVNSVMLIKEAINGRKR